MSRATPKSATPKSKPAGANQKSSGSAAPAGEQTPPDGAASEIGSSNLSLHELFEQQAADLLERADIDEEQKQNILLAMACPCCGAGGPSFSFKLKRRT